MLWWQESQARLLPGKGPFPLSPSFMMWGSLSMIDWLLFHLPFFLFPLTVSTVDYCEHKHVNKEMSQILTLFISNIQYLLNFINVPFLSAENCFVFSGVLQCWIVPSWTAAIPASCLPGPLAQRSSSSLVVIAPACWLFFLIHVCTRHLLSSSVDKDFCLRHDSLKINTNVS